MTRIRLGALVALVACTRPALADLPPLVSPPTVSRKVSSPDSSDADRLATALERFDFGDYDAVVRELELLVERSAAVRLSRGDRLEALRAYGIACVMVNRRTAAEGAFLLLLESAPEVRLDPSLVRPEAVEVFEAVRARNRDALWAAYRKGRGRRYAVLNLLPPAGQLQNRDYKKGYALLGAEVALLALDLTSGLLLRSWEGEHQDFPGHESAARALRPVNWVSFGALISVVVYGIIDGFVVGHRRNVEERAVEKQLLGRGVTPARRFADRLILDDGATFGVRF